MAGSNGQADTDQEPTPTAAATSAERGLRWIEPRRGWAGPDWAELWRYRELVYFLSWRDIQVRYKQTILGAAWAVLQPLLVTLVFTLLLGKLAGLNRQTEGTSYLLYVFAGMLPWMLFASGTTHSSQSLVGSANLITKVYFPRLIIPLGTIGVSLVDLAVSSVALAVMMAVEQNPVSWHLILAPLFLAAVVLLTAGVGSILAACAVSYRDFQYIVPFTIQLWMYITPVIYPASIVPARWRWLYYTNPMAGLVEGFRSAVLARVIPWPLVGVSLLTSGLVFILGVSFFRNVERRFADII